MRAAASICGRLSPISLARLPGRRAIQERDVLRPASRAKCSREMSGAGRSARGWPTNVDLDAVVAIERLLEGEDDEHLGDVFLHEFDAVLLPCPELRADEEDDGDAEAVELFGELEVDVREIDEDGEVGPVLADGGFEAAEFAVDAGQVADDFSDAHDGHVFCTDDAVESGLDHARAAHADEGGMAPGEGELAAQLVNEQCAVVLAAGFAGGDEDGGIGHACACPGPRSLNSMI